MHTICSKKTKL